jgi:hypothetical protein
MSDAPIGSDIPVSSTGSRMSTAAAYSPGSSASQPACGTCGSPRGQEAVATGASPFVYAIGRLEPRFPTLGVEKELAQAIGKAGTARLTDREAMHAVLTEPDRAYLVRQLCWILTIESTDAYVVVPHDGVDVRLLLGALRPTPRAGDLDVVIGTVGPFSDGRGCNGVRLPTVHLAQIYSFDVDGFVKNLSKPKDVSDNAFGSTVEEVLARASQLTDNMGVRDEHRAVNYLVTRDASLYTEVSQQYGKNASLAAVRVLASPLSGPRKVMEVVLEFRNRETDILERRFVNVDVSDVFPFKMSKWAPYTDR